MDDYMARYWPGIHGMDSDDEGEDEVEYGFSFHPFQSRQFHRSRINERKRRKAEEIGSQIVPATRAEEEDVADNEEEADIWNQYECRSLSFGNKHPGDIVEAASLSSVSLPSNSYPLQDSLGQQVRDGSLSAMQLEGIMYACERHSRRLPDGRRAGFFVGDSAGVGKGRQMAGIILDNLVRGRKRHVWLSASKDLHLDATRDLRDIGCTVQVIDSVNSLSKTKTLAPNCVLFCTYSELSAKGLKRLNKTRYDELIDFLCGPGGTAAKKAVFDGVIVFDECHKAKNYFEGAQEKKSTQAGTYVVQLQDALPNARVVYSSATGISAVENMGYMARMGLWGQGTSFTGFEAFATAVGGGKSVAALEMLALEFKATGCQVARNVGYHGAEFSTISANLKAHDAKMYRGAAELWHDTYKDICTAIGLCQKTPDGQFRTTQGHARTRLGQVTKMYWSAHQRFMRQLIAALKVPALAEEALRSLKAGHCVVIGLQTTGEAALGRALKEELEDLGATERDVVLDEEEDDENAAAAGLLDDDDRPARKRPAPKKSLPKSVALGVNKQQILNTQNGEFISVCKSILKAFILGHFPTHQNWIRNAGDPNFVPYLPDRYELVVALASISRDVPNLDSKMFIKKVFRYLVSNGPAGGMGEAAGAAGVAAAMQGRVPAYEANGTVVEAKRMQMRLLRRLNDLPLPPCALDDLVDRLGGPSQVAEMTGRQVRQIRLKDGRVAIQARIKAAMPRGSRTSKASDSSWANSEAANSLNVQEKGTFMNGIKLVAIISEAASTGISLHADRAAVNQRRRVHCTLELPWAADQAIQQLGRSHRTNQSSAPIFRLMSSGLGGEHRFISSVSRRLQSLGALTQGDRRASVGAMTFGEFQFESNHGQAALQTLYQSIIKREVPPGIHPNVVVAQSREHLKLDFDSYRAFPGRRDWCKPADPNMITEEQFFDALTEAAQFTGGLEINDDVLRLVPGDRKNFKSISMDVPRFFNRILGLPMGQQALLFNYFNALLEEKIKDAKRNGKYERGVQVLDGQSIEREGEPRLMYRDPGTGGRLILHKLIRDRGVDLATAIRELHYRSLVMRDPAVKREDVALIQPPTPKSLAHALNEANQEASFFRSREKIFGRFRTMLGIRMTAQHWRCIRPGTGMASASEMLNEALENNYSRCSRFVDLQKFWNEEYQWSVTECTHGPNCKHGGDCNVGRRRFPVVILAGNVISLWTRLSQKMQSFGNIPASERGMNIVQTNVTSTGQRIVGIVWPVTGVTELEKMVQELKTKHDDDRRRFLITGLPLHGILEKPKILTAPQSILPNEVVAYQRREAEYRSWLAGQLNDDAQRAMWGFVIDNNGTVTSVSDPVAIAKGIVVGSTLRKIREGILDRTRATNELRKIVVMHTNPGKTVDLEFYRARIAKDEVDDQRLWNEGLAKEAPAPVLEDVKDDLVGDPKVIRAAAENVSQAGLALRPASARALRRSQVANSDDEDFLVDDDEELGVEEEEEEDDDNVVSKKQNQQQRRQPKKKIKVIVLSASSMSDEKEDDEPITKSRVSNKSSSTTKSVARKRGMEGVMLKSAEKKRKVVLSAEKKRKVVLSASEEEETEEESKEDKKTRKRAAVPVLSSRRHLVRKTKPVNFSKLKAAVIEGMDADVHKTSEEGVSESEEAESEEQESESEEEENESEDEE